MSRGSEITRLRLKQIIDQAIGMHRTMPGGLATRQAHISIPNKHMLPVRILSVQGFAPPAGTPDTVLRSPLQVGSAFAFLAGYSAPAGSPAATADATGRGGDTAVAMRARAFGGSRGTAALQVLFPMTASAVGGSTGTATLTVV